MTALPVGIWGLRMTASSRMSSARKVIVLVESVRIDQSRLVMGEGSGWVIRADTGLP